MRANSCHSCVRALAKLASWFIDHPIPDAGRNSAAQANRRPEESSHEHGIDHPQRPRVGRPRPRGPRLGCAGLGQHRHQAAGHHQFDAFGNRITKTRVVRTNDFGDRIAAVRVSRTDAFGNRVSTTRVVRTAGFGAFEATMTRPRPAAAPLPRRAFFPAPSARASARGAGRMSRLAAGDPDRAVRRVMGIRVMITTMLSEPISDALSARFHGGEPQRRRQRVTG